MTVYADLINRITAVLNVLRDTDIELTGEQEDFLTFTLAAAVNDEFDALQNEVAHVED